MKFVTNGLVAIGVFLGFSLTLLIEFWADFFGQSLEPSETLVATLLGAAIAFSGTLISVFAAQEASENERQSMDQVTVHEVLAKLLDLNDAMLKNSRHFKTMSLTTRVVFGEGSSSHSFSKPLEGKYGHIAFTAKERALLLRLGRAEFFNSINEMQSISDSFTFLHAKHRDAYYALIDDVKSGGFMREGYQISSEIDKNSPRLISMMDVDGVFRSFLDRASPEVDSFLNKLIEFVNLRYGTGIGYLKSDLSPSADNHLRDHNF